jgi:hypothetical protein
MPHKMSFFSAIAAGAAVAGSLGIVGAALAGGVALVIGGIPAAVTAAVWGAAVLGVVGTGLMSFASGMADDDNGLTIAASGVAATWALAAGIHGFHSPKAPAQKITAEMHIGTMFTQGAARKTSTFLQAAPVAQDVRYTHVSAINA